MIKSASTALALMFQQSRWVLRSMRSISSSPSNANTFNSVNVTVATVNSSMTVAVTGAVIPICVTPTNPTIRITEGFATAFVEYTSPGAGARTAVWCDG